MFLPLIFAALLLGPLVSTPTPAVAQEVLSEPAIRCELNPNCPKPKRRQRGIQRGQRGVIVEGVVPSDQPNSVNIYINFAYNSADLSSDARITLEGLGNALRSPDLEGFNFMIAGHTDAKGGVEFNQRLSERRATAVRDYLTSQFGIPAARLASRGYGKSQLLDPDHPEDGVNRRVQVINAGAAPQR
jgi:outer membrane protein OmpA-like peptidoglycan-associated protein